MRASQYYAPTLRQAPAEAEIPSHKLLVRGGFIRPLTAGVFTFLPLGLRVLRRVENIVREEMNAAGALEVFMPVLQPQELWEKTGRWDTFQPQPLRTEDRTGRWFCLGPTHEEVITDLVAGEITSYRQLPLTLYQIQTKFRDEMRPRGGLIRVKEFTMKDAYSFDIDQAGLDRSYQAMYEAYVRIFDRLGLEVVVVEAEAGSMGGHDTREFMVLAESGEDTVFMCDSCDYAANAECAAARPPEPTKSRDKLGEAVLVDTPGTTTIEQVCAVLGTAPDQLVKTLLYKADDGFVAALVRGDRELNETKLQRVAQADELRMATAEEILQLTGAEVGYSGPVGLPDNVQIIADHQIAAMSDFVVGANQSDAHLVGVNAEVDFRVDRYADLQQAGAGDGCPQCAEGYLTAHRSIEMGHIFKLGSKYSQSLDAVFTDAEGREQPMVMGCYGIGVSRAVAAIVEQHHDENGIIWPLSVAAFDVVILLLDPENDELTAVANGLATELEQDGFEVMVDDRAERPGVKFKDADLIGYPLIIVVGRRTADSGEVEVRRRADSTEKVVAADDAAVAVRELAGEA